MSNLLLILLLSLLFLYLIIRQFTRQAVTWQTLLLLPAASAYSSYLDIQATFSQFSALPLLAALAIGAVAGLASGVYRGRHTQVFLDQATGRIFSKPRWGSSCMWLAQLIVRVGVGVLSYSPLGQHNLLIGMALIAISGLFFVSISTQKFIVYSQYKVLTQRRISNGFEQREYFSPTAADQATDRRTVERVGKR